MHFFISFCALNVPQSSLLCEFRPPLLKKRKEAGVKKSVLAVGIVFGIICAICVALYASLVHQEADSARAEAMERYGGEQVEVLVATKDIYPGETLTSSNTTMKTWLSDLLPDECITNFDEVKGLQVSSLVIAGEAVSSKRFNSETTPLDIPDGYVAISVPAEDVQAVGGALTAGMNVDVYATGSETSCIGEGLLVLATNADNSESGKASVSWVTLAVPLDQSQEFVTASQTMDIYFTLPSRDKEVSSDESTSEAATETTDAQEEVPEEGADTE